LGGWLSARLLSLKKNMQHLEEHISRGERGGDQANICFGVKP